MRKRGRPLEWPEAWTEFSDLVGGPAALRDALGYTSKTTIPDKIHGRSPWTKADRLLLGHLCREKNFDVSRLCLESK
jgi:hypothetical protein